VEDSVEDDAKEEAEEDDEEAEMKEEDEEQRRAVEHLLKNFIKLPTGRKRENTIACSALAAEQEASEGLDDDRGTEGPSLSWTAELRRARFS
jgi:hypothetical protein